jgi:hypothetical protein
MGVERAAMLGPEMRRFSPIEITETVVECGAVNRSCFNVSDEEKSVSDDVIRSQGSPRVMIGKLQINSAGYSDGNCNFKSTREADLHIEKPHVDRNCKKTDGMTPTLKAGSICESPFATRDIAKDSNQNNSNNGTNHRKLNRSKSERRNKNTHDLNYKEETLRKIDCFDNRTNINNNIYNKGLNSPSSFNGLPETPRNRKHTLLDNCFGEGGGGIHHLPYTQSSIADDLNWSKEGSEFGYSGSGSQANSLRARRSRIGNTQALIDKYLNPEPVVYQSDLNFIFKDKSPDQVVSLLGSNFSTWSKKPRNLDEFNMLDFGKSSALNKRNSKNKNNNFEGQDNECLTLQNKGTPMITVENCSVDDMGSSTGLSRTSSDSDVISVSSRRGKRVLFKEDSTEIHDIHEVEPPIEFAVRIGRQSTEKLYLSRTRHNSQRTSTSPIPMQLKPILKSRSSLSQDSICPLEPADEESDVVSEISCYTFKDYLRDTSSGRLSLPILPTSRSLISPRSPVPESPRDKNKQLSNSFRCSKEFALALQNLDGTEETDN